MYLKAEAPLPDILPGVGIAKGEEILMERSRKFTPDGLQQLATMAGFRIPAEVSVKHVCLKVLSCLQLSRRCHGPSGCGILNLQ